MSNNQWMTGPNGQWGLPQSAPQQQQQQWNTLGQSGVQQASAYHQQLHQQGQHTGYPQQQQYSHPQVQSGGVHIQTQLARAREEQRAREVELQRRKMQTMNVAEAKPLTSLDSLIGLEGMSPATRKKQASSTVQQTPLPPQPQSKPRAWTAGPTELQGVFSQHTVVEDNFGDFQGPPPPVVITSSYTRPISSVRSSPVMGGRARTASTPHSSHQNKPTSQVSPSAFPPLFSEVYNHCVRDGALSTELLFPVLMSSKLPKQQLGQLWQLANRDTPGLLTRTELFVLLGLVALAQNGHPNPTFADLQKAKSPPVPVLEAFKPQVKVEPKSHVGDFGSFQQGPTINNAPVVTNPQPVNHTPVMPPLPLATSIVPVSIPPAAPAQPVSAPITLPYSQSSGPSVDGDMYSALSELSIQPPTQASLPGLIVPSPLPTSQTVTTNDKYSALTELQSIQPPTQPLEMGPPSQTVASDDKYSAFGAFQAVPSTQPPIPGDKYSYLSDLSSTTVSSNSTSDLLSGSTTGSSITTSGGDFSVPKTENQPGDEFGSFVSMTPSLNPVELGGPGWADFSKPMEPSATAKPSPQVPITQGDTFTEKSFTSSVTMAGLESIVLEGLSTAAEVPPSNAVAKKTDSSKQNKPLSGLDILDQEMAARLLSKEIEGAGMANISEPLVPECLDEFGDFESFGGSQVNSVPSQEALPERTTADNLALASTCLERCAEVLCSCVGVFESVDEEKMLNEIAESEEGRNRLTGIVEVYRVAKRMYCVLKQSRPDTSLTELQTQIKDHWSNLQSLLPHNVMSDLYSESQPNQSPPTLTSDPLSDTISTCSLCRAGKTVTIATGDSLDGRKEDYPVSLYFHDGQCYHASCANFWLNVVQEQLPNSELK